MLAAYVFHGEGRLCTEESVLRLKDELNEQKEEEDENGDPPVENIKEMEAKDREDAEGEEDALAEGDRENFAQIPALVGQIPPEECKEQAT